MTHTYAMAKLNYDIRSHRTSHGGIVSLIAESEWFQRRPHAVVV